MDDASRDETGSIIRSLADPRIRLFPFSRNKGRGVARNYALQQARGEWFAILDMDDLSYPDRLEQALIAKDTGYDFQCTYVSLIDRHYNLTGCRGFNNRTYPRRFLHASVSGNGKMIRRIGYPPYRRAQDVTLELTLANRHHGHFLEDALYIYQEDSNHSVWKALQGKYYAAKQIGELVRTGILRKSNGVRKMYWGFCWARLILLAPFLLCPWVYPYTVRYRNRLGLAAEWRHSKARLDFLDLVQSEAWR